MKQGLLIAKLFQWAYDMDLDIELKKHKESINLRRKEITIIVLRKDLRSISCTFSSLNEKEEIEHFMKEAAIKLLVRNIEL